MDLEELQAAADAHAERQARIRALAASSAETRADIAERERVIRGGWHFDDALSYRDNMAALDEWERLSGTGTNATAHRAAPPQPRQAPAPVQKAAPSMPAETQAAWDRWAKAHIQNALRAWEKKRQGTMDKGVVDAIGQAFAHERRAMRDHVGGEKAQLLCRIMTLEAERAGRSVSPVSTRGADHA